MTFVDHPTAYGVPTLGITTNPRVTVLYSPRDDFWRAARTLAYDSASSGSQSRIDFYTRLGHSGSQPQSSSVDALVDLS